MESVSQGVRQRRRGGHVGNYQQYVDGTNAFLDLLQLDWLSPSDQALARLYLYVATGDVEGLQLEIIGDPKKWTPARLCRRTKSGCSLVSVAILYNQWDMLRFLIRGLHLSINERGRAGSTVLMQAAARGQMHLVRLFTTELGADVNVCNDAGQTALMYAAAHGHHEIVTFLEGNCAADQFLTDHGKRTAADWKILYKLHHNRQGIPVSSSASASTTTSSPTMETLLSGIACLSLSDSVRKKQGRPHPYH
jgi:hypothetical protein